MKVQKDYIPQTEKQQQINSCGFYAEPITDALREKYELKEDQGLVITYVDSSVSNKYRNSFDNEAIMLKEGDVLCLINGEEIKKPEDLKKAMNEHTEVLLEIKRKDTTREITIRGKFLFREKYQTKIGEGCYVSRKFHS